MKLLKISLLFSLFVICVTPAPCQDGAENALVREIKDRVTQISIRNSRGRIRISGSPESETITVRASSPSGSVSEDELLTVVKKSELKIEVSEGATERVDLYVSVPEDIQLKAYSASGAIEITGRVTSASIGTETGTVRADVPTEDLKINFTWTASRPRYFSQIELPEPKERRGGRFEISGRLYEEKREPKRELNISTSRGVLLFGVDYSQVPADLKERKLTEAAAAILETGNQNYIEAIRRVAPKLVTDQEALQRRGRGPTLLKNSTSNSLKITSNTAVRLNATVTDRHGRSIAGLKSEDFSIIEDGEPRKITQVIESTTPFNLVLLLDVSGSVEEKLDYIRRAALSFIHTAKKEDRIAVISFRDDVKLISDFTSDRSLLEERINQIEAGGATALYDALVYTLVHTLRPLRGERTAVVLLSDGDDNKSFLTFNQVVETVLESGTLIYPLYVPSLAYSEKATTQADPLRSRFLQTSSRSEEEGVKLAGLSGGTYYKVEQPTDLQAAYDSIERELRQAYTVTYESRITAELRERQIRVRVAREGAVVRLSPAIRLQTREISTHQR
jgi:VWFA-related protein